MRIADVFKSILSFKKQSILKPGGELDGSIHGRRGDMSWSTARIIRKQVRYPSERVWPFATQMYNAFSF